MFKKFFISTLLALATNFAFAKEFPMINLYVGYSAGSNTDKIARALQKELQKELPNEIVVNYKPGAGGDIAVGAIARDHSKENNLLITNINLPWWNINPNPNYNYKDLVPVAYLGTTPMIFVTHKSMPIRTRADWDRLDPAVPVMFGSSGIGAGTHLDGEVLFYKGNKKMIHVPYRGSAMLMPELLSGQIKAAYSFRLEIQEHIKNGTVVPFAVAGNERIKQLPDVPTLNEIGMGDAWLPVWQIVVASPGTDPAVVKAFQQALIKLYKDPVKREAFVEISDLQVDPKNVILKKEFIQQQVDIYKDYAKKIPTFGNQNAP
jgi:tripartite-type tricarboxylate transporter receptor subunit TctC